MIFSVFIDRGDVGAYVLGAIDNRKEHDFTRDEGGRSYKAQSVQVNL